MMLARQAFARVSLLCQRRFFAANAHHQGDAPAVTLFQYTICPFCSQAKALLSYADIDYETVEVNPLTKAELKPWCVSCRFVSRVCEQPPSTASISRDTCTDKPPV